MSKLVNPLFYPLAVLIGGVTLVIGVRLLSLPNLVILPTSVAATMVSAAVLQNLEPSQEKLERKQLEQELNKIKLMAENLASKAEILQQESQNLLNRNDWQVELLVVIQEACDRCRQLPQKINQLAQNIPNNQSLLSLEDLQQQLAEVKLKLKNSSGILQSNLEELAASLERNIALVQTGKDIRQTQVVELQKLIQESAGFLQQLQNKIRTTDLNDDQKVNELRQLTNELNLSQENVDVLIS